MAARLIAFLLAGVVLAPAALRAEEAEAGQCVDAEVKADLLAKRRHRQTRERLFLQTNRHELSVNGGYFVSDLFDGTYVIGGSYTYHMTEDVAIEASGAYTRFVSAGGPELERTFSVLGGQTLTVALFDASLVWAPIHGKLRAGGAILHFDVSLSAGAGIVDSTLSTGVAGVGGLGFKLFLGHAFAIRLDVRDHVYQQHLLPATELVNDLALTLGMSVYLPMRE